MINTSSAYKQAIVSNREFRVKDRITFKDDAYVDLSMDDILAYKINGATSSSGKFEIGAAVMKEYTATLSNMDGKFDSYDFEDADISSVIGLKLEDDSWEDLKKGTFRLYDAEFGDVTLQITAYDQMIFFDRPYSSCTLAYPATVLQIIQSACVDCEMTFDASTVQMGDYVVQERPDDSSLTYRDMVGYCAQIMGCFARIDHLGALSFGWYDFDNAVMDGLDGGIFDSETPYASGDSADGGSFSPWNTGDVYDCGDFTGMDGYHHFHDLKTQSINAQNIDVTGIQVTVKGSDAEEDTVYLYGETGYVLEIADNPLIQADTVEQVAKQIGDKIIHKRFRPLSFTAQSDPAVEEGDVIAVTTRQNQTYFSVITETTFSLAGAQSVSCTAETPTGKTFKRFSAYTKLLDEADKNVNRQLSAYDIAVQNMNQLAANTMGFYYTAVPQDDGSIISYRHDKPLLADSKVVYKSGIDGFFVTQDYKGTDDATAWTNGFDSSGNAVLNILSVIGINFSWAKGGTLSLGGANNGNGAMYVYDESGNQIGYWTRDGFYASNGKFAGELSAASGTFAGELKAASGTFTGELKAASGTFDGTVTSSDSSGFSVKLINGRLAIYYGGSQIGWLGYVGDDGLGGYNSGIYGDSDASHNITIGGKLLAKVGNGYIYGTFKDNVYIDSYLRVGTGLRIGTSDESVCPYLYEADSVTYSGNTYSNGLIVNANFFGTHGGIKARVVDTENYGTRVMSAYETMLPYFGDIGCGVINEEGECCVAIDDIFSETVDLESGYCVFLQKEGEGDLWVDKKELLYFIVKGTLLLPFSWEIKAVQKGYAYDRCGEIEIEAGTLNPVNTELDADLYKTATDLDMELSSI